MSDTIAVRTALACDDIRVEQGGKLTVIGLVNPIIGLGADAQAPSTRSAFRLHFLLSVDVAAAGDYRLAFRLRGLSSPRGQTVRLGVQFTEAAKNIPFPIGPLIFPLGSEKHGFKFQQQIGDRWRTIATWRFAEDDAPE